jgi:hypothetical protein
MAGIEDARNCHDAPINDEAIEPMHLETQDAWIANGRFGSIASITESASFKTRRGISPRTHAPDRGRRYSPGW